MRVDQLILFITNKAKETGNPDGWKVDLLEKTESIFSAHNIDDETRAYIMSKVEENVNSFFISMKGLSFTQEEYEKLKQTWHDCAESGNSKFAFFSLTDEYKEYSLEYGNYCIKYFEITGKVKFYEPKQTVKFILSENDSFINLLELNTLYPGLSFSEVCKIMQGQGYGRGVLKYNGKEIFIASRGLLTWYRTTSLDELICNVDFFIRPCPVCSRYAHVYANLDYCPECDKLELIAYPMVSFGNMMSPIYEADPRQELLDEFDDIDNQFF